MKQGISIQERLKDLRTERHLKLEELAELTNISKSALGSYENDEYKEISHKAIIKLADFYGVSTDYLLCQTENRNHPGIELSELHLNDDMLELLTSRRINNRLLCEIVTHEDFMQLMTDAEIPHSRHWKPHRYRKRIIFAKLRTRNGMPFSMIYDRRMWVILKAHQTNPIHFI